MPVETMHTMAMIEAQRLLDAEPKKWAKVGAAELASEAVRLAKEKATVKQALETAIDKVIAADRSGT